MIDSAPSMAKAYGNFHRAGHAHSFEAYNTSRKLVGGMYGVWLKNFFAGESMAGSKIPKKFVVTFCCFNHNENMATVIGKREFTLNTSKYLKMVEEKGQEVIITHQKKPSLKVVPLRPKSVRDLAGTLTQIESKGDLNEPVLDPFDQW